MAHSTQRRAFRHVFCFILFSFLSIDKSRLGLLRGATFTSTREWEEASLQGTVAGRDRWSSLGSSTSPQSCGLPNGPSYSSDCIDHDQWSKATNNLGLLAIQIDHHIHLLTKLLFSSFLTIWMSTIDTLILSRDVKSYKFLQISNLKWIFCVIATPYKGFFKVPPQFSNFNVASLSVFSVINYVAEKMQLTPVFEMSWKPSWLINAGTQMKQGWTLYQPHLLP